MEKQNLILAFESSCDETSVAVIKDGHEILSNVIATQINSHKRFGGVVLKLPAVIILNKLQFVLKPHFKRHT